MRPAHIPREGEAARLGRFDLEAIAKHELAAGLRALYLPQPNIGPNPRDHLLAAAAAGVVVAACWMPEVVGALRGER